MEECQGKVFGERKLMTDVQPEFPESQFPPKSVSSPALTW